MTMRHLNERIVDALGTARRRPASRRGILTGSAKLAAGGALALAFAGFPAGRGLRPALAQEITNDVDALNYALTLEYLEYAFYRDGLEAFSEADFARERPASVYANFRAIRDHEGAHVETLVEVITGLGGTPVEEGTYDFGYEDLAGFIEVAALLENTGVMAYTGAVAAIQDPDLQTAAATIATIEARHAAYLNQRVGASPFPAAFDTPKSPAEILEAASRFIVA